MSLIMQNILGDTETLSLKMRLTRQTTKIELIHDKLNNCRLTSSVNKDFFTFQVTLLTCACHA